MRKVQQYRFNVFTTQYDTIFTLKELDSLYNYWQIYFQLNKLMHQYIIERIGLYLFILQTHK